MTKIRGNLTRVAQSSYEGEILRKESNILKHDQRKLFRGL